MSNHFQKQALEIERFIARQKKPFVVELGCNDGIMLKHLSQKGVKHLGIEPAVNVALMAQKNKVRVLSAFFKKNLAQKIIDKYGQADVVCASNTMCSVENLHSAFAGFEMMLKDDGVLFFEDPYLYDIITLSSYDQIYDEHIYYFSGLAVSQIARRHNLTLTDMKHQSVHGGSMRYYLKKGTHHQPSPRVRTYLLREKGLLLHQIIGYKKFSSQVKAIAGDLRQLLVKLKAKQQTVVGYGATSKSTTLLNYSRIGTDILTYISDNSPTKIGKFTPGTHIPVKPRVTFLEDNPPYTLLLAWNHQREIFTKEKVYRQKGGKFITYFPKITIHKL